MSETLMAVANGAVLALVFAVLVRLLGGRFRLELHAGMLLLAALFYMAFALRGGSAPGVAVELVGIALFGGAAVVGLVRQGAGWIALGWAVHPLWDMLLHSAGPLATYTPHGWVAACLGFDLVLAAWLAVGWGGEGSKRLRPAPV